jgi:hypothetical protein
VLPCSDDLRQISMAAVCGRSTPLYLIDHPATCRGRSFTSHRPHRRFYHAPYHQSSIHINLQHHSCSHHSNYHSHPFYPLTSTTRHPNIDHFTSIIWQNTYLAIPFHANTSFAPTNPPYPHNPPRRHYHRRQESDRHICVVAYKARYFRVDGRSIGQGSACWSLGRL